jgi:hypothetical protein
VFYKEKKFILVYDSRRWENACYSEVHVLIYGWWKKKKNKQACKKKGVTCKKGSKNVSQGSCTHFIKTHAKTPNPRSWDLHYFLHDGRPFHDLITS